MPDGHPGPVPAPRPGADQAGNTAGHGPAWYPVTAHPQGHGYGPGHEQPHTGYGDHEGHGPQHGHIPEPGPGIPVQGQPYPGGHPGPAEAAQAWAWAWEGGAWSPGQGIPSPAPGWSGGPATEPSPAATWPSEAAAHASPRPPGQGRHAQAGFGIPTAEPARQEQTGAPFVPHPRTGGATAPDTDPAAGFGPDPATGPAPDPAAGPHRAEDAGGRAARRKRAARTEARVEARADADADVEATANGGGRARRRARTDGTTPDGAGAGAGRRTARRARTANSPGSGPGPGSRGRRVVRLVGGFAALAATGMLVLRGSDALAGVRAGLPTAPGSASAPASISAATPASGKNGPAAQSERPAGSPALPSTGAGTGPGARTGTGTGPGTAAAAPDAGGQVLQVVAHPDDDLYFMNPDLRYSLAAGHRLTTVYLTSGEADGINAGAAKRATTPPDKPAYAEARQNGIRAAYAQMATGDRTSAWKRTSVPTKGGGHAEVDVLAARPEVNLVWLQLREAGTVYDAVPESLRGLWDGKAARLESVLASGSPVKQRFSYSKDQLVQTLAGVLEQYGPTTVRAQDPTPGRYPDTKKYTDHQDHFYGARFLQAALAAYAKDVPATDRPHFAVQNYVGYFNGSLPGNLAADEAKEKLDIMGIYAWVDRQNHCGSTAGCGDLKVADRPEGNNWTSSVNYARGSGTSWLASDKEHGLWAFKALDGQVAVWHRAGPLGPWTGPRLLPGTGMDPGVSAVALQDGRIAVFTTRTSFGARPADYRREVVYAVQKRPGAEEFGDWQSLGTPETADDTWTSDISAPAVSADGTGRLAAYVRDGASTLRGRVQRADGTWGPWEQHGGTDLHGTPATATDAAGRRMVFTATTRSVTGWVQPKPGAALGPATPTGLPDTTLPLTVDGREGGVRIWFRKPGSGDVRTALVTAEDKAGGGSAAAATGLKAGGVTDLGGLQGFGAVAASGHVLAGRAAGGQLGSDLGRGRPWARSPLMFVGAPAAVQTGTLTGRNTVSLAVVGLDARLYVTSSVGGEAKAGTSGGGNAYLTPWQPVDPRPAKP
ncbi:PIG-L family deacetylase [Streptomyces sp. NPDC004050]